MKTVCFIQALSSLLIGTLSSILNGDTVQHIEMEQTLQHIEMEQTLQHTERDTVQFIRWASMVRSSFI